MKPEALQIGLLYPDIMGTYGDNGNALVLKQRAIKRGIATEIIPIKITDPIPNSLDIYLIGGAEDTAQHTAVEKLQQHSGLKQAAAKGTPILAICAAIQILGNWYKTLDNIIHPGIGLVDCVSNPLNKRASGEIITNPNITEISEPLIGFENHRGNTELGNAVKPLGNLVVGIGNGNKTDGFQQKNIYGTYMHGPILARNPAFADLLLKIATGKTELQPLRLPKIDNQVQNLRKSRAAASGLKI